MNISKTKLLTLFVSGFFLFGLTGVSEAANYSVLTTTTTVDGDTFCGGKCDSGDTIIIKGGARGNLLFKDFDGAGSYITITNENINPNKRVEIITGSVGSAYAGLEIRDCSYIDIRGNNDPDVEYGIKVICDGTPVMSSAVWIRQESDHINLSYIETAFDGNTGTSGNGFFIQDATLDKTWIYDTINIHHTYTHGSRYAGMYLGQNYPEANDNPYIANLSVHDNLLEDLGSYGMTIKGVHPTSDVTLIYNNTVKRTGLVYDATPGEKRNGIKTHYYYGSTYANIYGNWIEATKGAGFIIGNGDHQFYNNTLVNCGTNNHVSYGHAIKLDENGNTANIYDNIIIQPVRYGIYNAFGTGTKNVDRNLIGDPGVGCVENDPQIVEGSGDDANICHADVADFNFNAWSDNNDYSDDDFTFGPASTCVSQSGTCCSSLQTCQGGSAVSSSDCPNVCCVGGTCEDAEICNDLVDNDGDGDIDCADADCVADPVCVIPLLTCLAQSGNCCEGLFCGGTVVPSSDCGNCCLGICSFDGTVTCATQGFQCCTNGCQSGYKGYLEDTCPGEEVCCEICYVGGGIVSPPEEIKIKNPVKTSVFAQIIENTLMWSLSIVGSLALLMLIIGGAMYIGSAGDEQKVLNAKKIVTYTIIGTILILVSYAVIVVVGEILT